MRVLHRPKCCYVPVGIFAGVVMLTAPAVAQAKAPLLACSNDFPFVCGYRPGHSLAYDPKDPHIALKYLNSKDDGVLSDINGINFVVADAH